MKITPLMPQGRVEKYGQVNKTSKTSETYPMGNDEVRLSDSAQSFATIYKVAQQSINTASPEYAARVEDIAKRISEGTYSVSSEDVAEKILEDLQF